MGGRMEGREGGRERGREGGREREREGGREEEKQGELKGKGVEGDCNKTHFLPRVST